MSRKPKKESRRKQRKADPDTQGAQKNKRSVSMLWRIMMPMILLVVVQMVIFIGILAANGGFSYFISDSYNMISEKSANRKNYVETMLNQKTGLVYETAQEVNRITERLLQEENTIAAAIRTDKELNKRILAESAESLISLIRRDLVNDAFIILDTGTLYDEDGTQLRPGLYIRDTDIEANSVTGNDDIFMELGSSEVARSFGLPLDSGWSLYLDVSESNCGCCEFYHQPIETYADFQNTPLYNLGYWSSLSTISSSQLESIKYSLPLIAEDGTVYGVIGIGILEKTIQKNMSANDFSQDSACYVLGADLNNSGQYTPQLYNGPAYGRLVNERTVLSADRPIKYGLYDFTAEGGISCIGSIERLNLYSVDSPYTDQLWALISVADKRQALSVYRALLRTVLISVLVTFVISIIVSLITSRKLSRPVEQMIRGIDEGRNSDSIAQFSSSGISEIDFLGEAVVELQEDAKDYAFRVSRIIAMSGNKMGVFLYNCRSERVFVGENMMKLLHMTAVRDKDGNISEEEFWTEIGKFDKKNTVRSLPAFDESEEETWSGSTEVQCVDDTKNSTVWLKFSLSRNKDYVFGLVQDVTDTVEEKKQIAKVKDDEYTAKLLKVNQALREAYAAATHANHAKTDFLSRMSHDIRTPMNAIAGMTAIAKENLDDREKVADCLEKIAVSERFLLSLINEVLDMSKIESGKFVLAEEKLNILELVDNLIEMIKPSVNEKDHQLRVHMNHVEHENVLGDSLRIQQIFMNIMSNAIKYTPPGGHIDFTVSEKPSGQANVGCYEFIFKDDGNGMKPEFLEKLFEPFERADDERVNKEQGTGLGMTITQSLVKMMNGDIAVESAPGVGSTFTVTLFLSLCEPDPVSIEELKGLRVLVADTDKAQGKATCAMLTSIGMQGEWVRTFAQAYERIADRDGKARTDGSAQTQDKAADAAAPAKDAACAYDAVIIEWIPGQLAEEPFVRTCEEFAKYAPVVICSAYDWSGIEQAARKAGVGVYLSRPLFQSRLITVMKSLFHQEEETTLDVLSRRKYNSRVLLVDDNELNREIATEILGMTGLNVQTAKNGKEALDLFAASAVGDYQMIFMDIQMPVMDGYEATRQIRALPRGDAKTIPIVAMTADAFAEDVQAAKNAGMNAHIAKPLDLNRLGEILDRWLNC